MVKIELTKWDLRLLYMAKHISQWSKDPSTKVGCVLADRRHRIVSTGFNGFPSGVKDNKDRLKDRDLKLQLVQHAERNAIAFSTSDLQGCTCYVWPQPPCAQCSGALAQAGIRRIVAPSMPLTGPVHDKWGHSHSAALIIWRETQIRTDFIPMAELEPPERKKKKSPGNAGLFSQIRPIFNFKSQSGE